MLIRKYLLLSIFGLLPFVVSAQSGAKIQFEKNTFNFGSINEEEGPVSYEFVFTNTGTEPVIISHVKASCGCTTPGWSKEPVMPGQQGFVKAQYDPRNRPGTFNKSLTVTSNSEPSSFVLFISGHVLPKQRTAKDEFPKKMGSIRVSSDKIDLGRITTKDTLTRTIKIHNDSERPLILSGKTDAPKHISVKIEADTIEPNKAGKVKFVYNALKKNDYGDVSDQITIYTNEETDNKKSFLIKASIMEYFPPMSDQQLAVAPKLIPELLEMDLGKVKPGNTLKSEIELKNVGKQELQVRKVKSNAVNVNANTEKQSVKAGNSTKLKIQYTAPEKEGADNKVIYIYTNDPQSPLQTILIKAMVTSEQ